MEGKPQRVKRLRLAATLALFVGLLIAGKASVLTDSLTVDALRAHVADAGALGVVLYVAAFAVGILFHVPGMIFVAAGILAYGKAAGFGVTLAAAIVAVSLSFVVIRGLGGKALTEIERPFVRKLLAKLDARPITTIVLLRTVLWLAPALNYALALSGVRLRDYVIGSALGLVAPILAATLLFEWVMSIY